MHGVFPSNRRVLRILTENSISLSRYWRQWGIRYAIRAGRNLPDKEFRYLRTVIVTAAVHWDFNSELAPLLLIFQHWAGVRPYTSSIDLAEPCVFSKQSIPPWYVPPIIGCPKIGHLSPEVTDAICLVPSASFSSSALVYSTCPPVSVWGTVYNVGVISWKSFAAHSIQ